MSWLADASANKIVKSYIQDFVDISGNFRVIGGESSSTSETTYYTYAWATNGSAITGDAAPDNFGMHSAVSEDGKTFVTSAFQGDNPETNQGTFYVFRFNDDTQSWYALGNDIGGLNTSYDDRAHGVQISRDGNIVALTGAGVASNSNGTDSQREARIYEYNSGTNTWDQLGSSIVVNATANIWWQGNSYGEENIALNGDGTIVALGVPVANSNYGLVRVYQYTSGSWVQLGSDLIGSATNSTYGTTIGLNTEGTVLSTLDSVKSNASGYNGEVFTYEYSGGAWTKRESGNGVYLDATHTYAMAMNYDATVIALGSHTYSGSKGMAAVYQYNADTQTWSQMGSNIYNPNSNGEFGQTGRLAISGDGTVFVAGSTYGSYVYKYKNSAWSLFGSNTSLMSSSSQYMGPALNSDGTILVVANHKANSKAGQLQSYKATASVSDSSNASAYGVTTTTVTDEEFRFVDVSGGIVSFNTNTMKIEDGTVDISGTTWINQGASGASIATSNQGAFIVESAGTSSSNSVVYVETAGQTQAFSIRENGDLYSANALQHSSDDRRKTNEQYITNATETIQKLSPQIYTKLNDLVQNGGTGTKTESGLIAQEIYYNAPELRHLVHIEDEYGNKLTPQEYDLSGNDIQNDPDYTALGWGNKSAYVDYTGLIPYLIKSNQEQQAMIDNKKQALLDQKKTLEEDVRARIASLESK